MTVESDCHVGHRALPTLTNVAMNITESLLQKLGLRLAEKSTLTILKDASGIIKPSRMTLLLGPPASGKTTLLLALAGRLDPTLKVGGEVTYNGHTLEEFVPQKTAAYISQHDVHVADMTVKETLDFSARCQGVGSRYDLLQELAKREMEAGILPEVEVDLFMKATAMEGVKCSLQTDYTLRILGLDVCSDTIIGNEMRRGISGGQKKRVTTGEIMVGPAKTLFMDEISTGLDSLTTFQIVKCLQQIVRLGETTVLMSLLQPPPETFDLFDDVILLSEGQIVYQGPREHVLEFFESCGFRCPERKGVADFLQEVTSRKDQEQYWMNQRMTYRYFSVTEFRTRFKSFHVGQLLEQQLLIPFVRKKRHKAALVFSEYSVSPLELLRASFAKEWLLFKRNLFFYIFRTVQLMIVAVITSTVFLRTQLHTRTEEDGMVFIGALLFGINTNLFNGFAESFVVIAKLPVFYKQRDNLLYPPWVFTLPNILLRIPVSMLESTVWVGVTYFVIGFAPEASRFFKYGLLMFLIQQMADGFFRVTACFCRSMTVASFVQPLIIIFMFILGGFLLPRGEIPSWLRWGYWISPLSYSYNALTVNEMLSPRWMNKLAPDGRTLGVAVLQNSDIFTDSNWYWIGAGVLLGYVILFNTLFTLALMYLNPLGKPQPAMPDDAAHEKEAYQDKTAESRRRGNMAKSMLQFESEAVFPFTPLTMSFEDVNYYVDMPAEMRNNGVKEERLQLLRGVTGVFRPGVLTALMGVSGAGKTTILDVLAGRKTGGYVEGDIWLSGYPKNQVTFTRVSGYCEQNDIHSPQITVKESLIFSAFLRLPKEFSDEAKMRFVDEVMGLVELSNLKDAVVGIPGVTGLSTGQRKRLTIAVELAANPSIIFMDEPTSGLDARAAAIVMRTVRNTVDTGRTVICTIHQPSIDVFESFDELLLMKRGGQVIYSGPLGPNSQRVIEYFEDIPGVIKIKDKYNPATWMMEVSSTDNEIRLGIDFSVHYESSNLCKLNKVAVRELSKPVPGTNDLCFETRYPQSAFEQFKYCLWKQCWNYWRTPEYNLARLLFSFAASLLLGTVFWQVGKKRESSADLSVIIGAMYATIMFMGVTNSVSVQPLVAVERTVFYREKAAGLYSTLPYAISLVFVEIPCVFIQTLYYVLIVYSMMGFEWTVVKFLWFLFIAFFAFLYFTYFGMMCVTLAPNIQVAGVFSSTAFPLFNLFAGFFVPKPRIPKWWIWYYWICPVAWTVYGLIVTQYGDVDDVIKVPGGPDQTIKSYIEDYYGYDLDFMGVVSGAIVGFTILFASVFTYCISKLNFQSR